MTPYIVVVDDKLDGCAIRWFNRSLIPIKKPHMPVGVPFQRVTYVPTGVLITNPDGEYGEIYRREEDMK